MSSQEPLASNKEVLSSNSSSDHDTLDSPSGDQKAKSAHSSSDSDTSSNSDGISIHVYNEHGERDNDLKKSTSRIQTQPLSRYATGVSVATNGTTDPSFEVDFEDDDPTDPKNWPFWYRASIIFSISFSTLTVVMYSTSYTSGIPGIMSEFNIPDETIPVLGITTYMIGLALGSVVLAPLSEMYGRRPIYLVAMAMFGLLTIPCGLAPNLEAILITRFFGAIAGSAMIGNSPGTVNDIVLEEHRALAFSIWSIGPMNGPVVGPLIGGFVYQYLGWRWTNWIVGIASVISFVLIVLIKETYAPAILRNKAEARRKEMDDSRYWCRYDDKQSFWPLLRVNLSRPFVMAVTEPICIFWDVYIALIYGVLYLCFVAYPLVFTGLRGWSPGFVGLAFIGIGIGSLITISCEPLLRKMILAHPRDPVTGRPEPEAMVSVVCIAAVLVPIGELIFAWTCTPNVHWIVPIISGIPFGAGNCAVFVYASNYLVHSYGIYAASALAGNSVLRSLLGGTLPLAGPKLYETLGPHWAGTMLGLIELALVPIPFVFYRYGKKIRMNSSLIRSMQEDKEKLEAKKRDASNKRDRQAAKDAIRELGVAGEAEKVAPVVDMEGLIAEIEIEKELSV